MAGLVHIFAFAPRYNIGPAQRVLSIRREMIVVSAMGKRPHSNLAAVCYLGGMNLLLLVVVLLLLFGGGGFYFGGPVIGGSGLGLVLLICLIVFLMGGFRQKS